MLITLLAITLISGAVLGYVHKLTSEPIQISSLKAQNEAIEKILPSYETLSEAIEVMPEDGTAPLTFFRATDANGVLVGTAVKTYTIKGFSGNIDIIVGFDPAGIITGYQVLKHAETPGLGSKMQEWFRPSVKKVSLLTKLGISLGLVKEDDGSSNVVESKTIKNLIGVNPATVNLTVSKDGGDVDAITASTISSRAFLDAISRGYNTYMKNNSVSMEAPEAVEASETVGETLEIETEGGQQ
ncbi:MAG: RnfABCDGE type electron transport complex subunit G [Mangrovibacterium sp.]